jgi:hypothetical protein
MHFIKKKILLVIIIFKRSVKNLGFLEFCTDRSHLVYSKNIINDISKSISKKNRDKWSEIFIRNKQMHIYDKKLSVFFFKRFNSYKVFFILRFFLRKIHFIFDFINFFNFKTNFELYQKTNFITKNYPNYITFTNNIERMRMYNKFEINTYELMVSKKPIDGFKKVSKFKFGIFAILECIYLKFRFSYISVSQIMQCYASLKLFQLGSLKLNEKYNIDGALLREGTSALSKTFLFSFKNYNFKKLIFYPALAPVNSYILPKNINGIIFSSKYIASKINLPPDIKRYVFEDYPVFDWRKISKKNKHHDIRIGVLMGDGHNRYSFQKYCDDVILDLLKNVKIHNVILKTHPQENIKFYRHEYNEDIKRKFSNVSFDKGEIFNFFEKIDVLITYTKSLAVQEAVLSKIPVIEVVTDKNIILNEEISLIGKSMLQQILIEDFNEINFFKKIKNAQKNLEIDWLNFINNLHFDVSKEFISQKNFFITNIDRKSY